MFNCSCCGTELTTPYLYNGGVYGWTCIKKVKPSARKLKKGLKPHKIEFLEIKYSSEKSLRGDAFVIVNGQKTVMTVHHEWDFENNKRSPIFEIYSNNIFCFNNVWYLLN